MARDIYSIIQEVTTTETREEDVSIVEEYAREIMQDEDFKNSLQLQYAVKILNRAAQRIRMRIHDEQT